MTKKLPSKLLSVILTIAICATTVFGCLITANAADGPSYVITGDECAQGSTAASATVEFTVPNGMAAGKFTVDNTDSWYSSVSASVQSATPAEGVYNADDFADVSVSDGTVVFNIKGSDGNSRLYTTVALRLSFVLSAGIANDINVTLSGLEFGGLYEEKYTEFTGTDGVIAVGCSHAYKASGTPVYTSTENNYAVYSTAACTICGAAKEGYQVVPGINGKINAVSYTGKVTTVELLDSTQPNSESNPYIINNPGQIFALSRDELTCDGTVVGKNHEYFKVADGIDAFYINGGETVANLTSAAEVKAYFEANPGNKWWSNGSAQFNGSFDGNGVTIYGLYSDGTSAGLFPYSSYGSTTAAPQTIKNITVKNSYLTATASSGAIIGAMRGNAGSTVIENCTSTNNYISSTKTSEIGGGALVGRGYGTVTVNNCLVYNNTVENSYATTYNKNVLLGYSGGSTYIKNVIALGVTPWNLTAPWSQNHIDTGNFVNVFTDQDIQALYNFATSQNTTANAVKYNINGNIDPDDLLGANAAVKTAELTAANKAVRDANGWPFPGADLDWNTADNTDGVWFTGANGSYPSLVKAAKVGDKTAETTNRDWKLLAVNIEYEDSGSFALNFHYAPPYTSQDASLYVATSTEAESGKFQKITTSTASPYAGTVLPAGAKMFTIPNLSARDIDVLWLPTIVTKSADGSETVYSETQQISVEDYATKVILGDAVYANSTTNAQMTADKNVAAALINYGYAADAALDVSGITDDEYGTISVYSTDSATLSLLDSTQPNSENNPYIIQNANQMYSFLIMNSVNSAGEKICTTGTNYFKVADGIKAFYMNGGETVAAMTTPTQIKEYFEVTNTSAKKVWTSDTDRVFTGHFDGNGVEIYGLRSDDSRGALFTNVSGNVTIKNVTVKNSYLKGSIVGGIIARTANSSEAATVTIENCAVVNNYMEATSNGANAGVASLVAQTYGNNITANNILIYGNGYNNITGYSCGLVSYGWSTGCSFSNIVSIGYAPYRVTDMSTGANASYHYVKNEIFSNVYTDYEAKSQYVYNGSVSSFTYKENEVKQLAVADMQGAAALTNCANLDWTNTWAYGAPGEYPILVKSGTNSVSTVSEYSGTPDATLEGSGTKTDPYIIKTADEFAAVALGKIDGVTENTYYEVDSTVKAFYMHGGAAAANLTDVNEVKDYFEKNGSTTANSWQKTAAFKGHLDGNGVVISGLYAYVKDADQWVAAALFPQVLGHSSIKNITLKNSYISAKHAQGNVAAIVGGTQNCESANDATSSITIENIEIINNYVSCRHTTSDLGASILAGYLYNRHYLDANNILICGNEIDNSAYENTDDDAEKERRSRSGFVTITSGTGWAGAPTDAQKNSKIKNVICLGSNPWAISYDGTNYSTAGWNMANMNVGVIKNVYTDQSLDILIEYTKSRNEANNSDTVFAQQNIVKVTAEDMQGASAKTVATVLAWDTTWFAGAYNDYPSFSEPTKLTSDLQSKYDALTLGNYDNYAVTEATSRDCYMYASSLNLKVNPYIAFTFAFRGDYAANKASVKVTLTTADGKEYTTTAAEMVNNTDPDNFAGRYHLYRFKDVPVEYLCKDISVKVEYEGKTTQLGTFSVEGFALDAYNANRIMPSLYYSTRAEAAKALLFYTQMINARYGSVE